MEQTLRIIDNLTPQQIELLMEYVEFAKRPNTDFYPPVIKANLYDFEHGREESIELLNLCLYDLIRIEKLTPDQSRELALIVAQRDLIEKPELQRFSNGVDDSINEIRATHKKTNPKTNGKEYL